MLGYSRIYQLARIHCPAGTNYKDLGNSIKIQGAHKSLDFLGIS